LPASALDRLEAAIGELAGHDVVLERPKDPEHGDYATNVALQSAGTHRRPPREFAEELAERVVSLDEVDRAAVAGPGFVNLWLVDSFLALALAEIDENYGSGFADPQERIQVELVSANPTGPLTVASARNGAYGDSVARLLSFAGHDVEREYYWNDAGNQIDRFRASVDAARNGEEPPEDGYHGDYIAELAKIEGDPVPAMLDQIMASLERFRVYLDSNLREIELVPQIPAAIAKIDTYEADGTLWAKTSVYGDEKDRPLLRSSDGTHLYYAADVAYLGHKLERFDRAIYVLGADHHGYVARLEAAAEMLGYDRARIEVLLYQLVHLTRGGQQTKMSKRAGDVVFLDDFMDEIGVDAARWYLVNRGPDQTIEIDIDLAAEKTAKNPVYYVQYAHARIAGILRNAPQSSGAESASNNVSLAETLEPAERELIKRLAEFPGIAREATRWRAPQGIPVYAIKVADDFHRFYHDVRVLGEDAQAFRLGLCRATQLVIGRCLDLVGIEAPERM
jgi:arginyl-tRNA synthetase